MYMSYSFTGGRSKMENVIEKSRSIKRRSSALRFLQSEKVHIENQIKQHLRCNENPYPIIKIKFHILLFRGDLFAHFTLLGRHKVDELPTLRGSTLVPFKSYKQSSKEAFQPKEFCEKYTSAQILKGAGHNTQNQLF